MKKSIPIITKSFFKDFGIGGIDEKDNISVYTFSFRAIEPSLISALKKSVKADYFFVSKIISGSLTIRVDFKTYNVDSDTCFFILPNGIRELVNYSQDCVLEGFSFNGDFIKNTKLPENFVNLMEFFAYKYENLMKFSKEDSAKFSALVLKLSKRIRNVDKEIYGMELLVNSFSEFILELAGIYRKHDAMLGPSLNHNQDLVNNFLKLARKHHLTQRNLSFYSDKLGVTSKHLSETAKKTSGRTAGQIIDELNLLEAKRLLEQTDLSISEISYELKFANPAFFSKFFSRYAGISPRVYRVENC